MKLLASLILSFGLVSCGPPQALAPTSVSVNKTGSTVKTRFAAPEGFTIVPAAEGSFVQYLQDLPLKPEGTDVFLYNKTAKRHRVHAAVVDMEVGDKDLQQCADAILRLRGEYLFHTGQKRAIAFHFTNGFLAAYTEWAAGNRIQLDGNDTRWVKKAAADDSYPAFRRYMDLVFTYAGTRSLEKELKPVADVNDLQIGDVFIRGGSPGHAVIVVNVAKNANGEKRFLLAQSYMPAQDIHVLVNPNDARISPWYSTDFGEELVTPEWTFNRTNLKRFP